MLFWGLLGMVIAELALLLLLVLPARDDQGKRERDQSKPDREDLLMALGPYSAREEEVEKAPHLERRERAELVSVPVPVAALRQPEPQQKPDPEPTTRVTALPARAQPEPEPEPEPDLPPQHRRARPDAPRARPNTAIAENCQIELWRGYVKCQLYAALLDRPGATGFAFSPAFRLRDENAPTEQAVIALETLIDYLEGDGWTVVFTGRRWYQLRLARCREGF